MERLTEAIEKYKELSKKKDCLARTFRGFRDYGNPKSTITSGAEENQHLSEEYGQLAEWLEELKQYKDKKEQGLLIELPVPIGTKVYKVVEDKTATTIETIKHNGHEYHRTIPCYFVCRDLFTFSMLNEVGKTVFLTLDEAREAESALAKMGGK